jgi:hypothetical protein
MKDNLGLCTTQGGGCTDKDGPPPILGDISIQTILQNINVIMMLRPPLLPSPPPPPLNVTNIVTFWGLFKWLNIMALYTPSRLLTLIFQRIVWTCTLKVIDMDDPIHACIHAYVRAYTDSLGVAMQPLQNIRLAGHAQTSHFGDQFLQATQKL